jgi:hypothetical protein
MELEPVEAVEEGEEILEIAGRAALTVFIVLIRLQATFQT